MTNNPHKSIYAVMCSDPDAGIVAINGLPMVFKEDRHIDDAVQVMRSIAQKTPGKRFFLVKFEEAAIIETCGLEAV